MTSEEALLRLGDSTADAVAKVLRTLCGDVVDRGPVSVVPEGTEPLHPMPVPAVAARVSYVNGVTGGNVFLMNALGARKLAAAMMGGDVDAVAPGGELGELELSAVGEAANQMLAAASTATSAVLGEEVEIGPPETRVFERPAAAADAYEHAAHATSVSFTVYDEPCRLVQLVPNAFIVRMTRAFANLEAEMASDGLVLADGSGSAVADLTAVRVRLAAELGRARIALGRAVSLAPGAVVALDRDAGEPIDLLVNGRPFGRGTLLFQDSRWAVRVDELDAAPAGDRQPTDWLPKEV